MARASWKVPYVCKNFLKIVTNDEKNWKKIFTNYKIFFKRSTIIPYTLINKKIKIYNGKRFKTILIRPQMVGHKMGEFVVTKIMGRKIAQRKLAKLKKKKNKKKK